MRVGSAEVGGLVEVVEWERRARPGVDVGHRRRPARALAAARAARRPHPRRAAARLRRRGLRHLRLGGRAGRGADRARAPAPLAAAAQAPGRARAAAPPGGAAALGSAASAVPAPAPGRAEADRQALDAAVAQAEDEGAAGPRPRRFGLPREDVVAGPAVEAQAPTGRARGPARRPSPGRDAGSRPARWSASRWPGSSARGSRRAPKTIEIASPARTTLPLWIGPKKPAKPRSGGGGGGSTTV